MPVLQFKGKTAVECYHHTVPHHVLEFDPKLSVLGKGEKPGLDGPRQDGEDRRIVVYCEKIWVHRDDLAKYEAEAKRTVRPMLVPFSLK